MLLAMKMIYHDFFMKNIIQKLKKIRPATQNQLKSKIAIRAPQNVQLGLGLVNPSLLGATNNFHEVVFLI